MADPERLSFSIALLADAENAPRPLSACSLGHLVVAGRNHWKPEALNMTSKTLTCSYVEACDGGGN